MRTQQSLRFLPWFLIWFAVTTSCWDSMNGPDRYHGVFSYGCQAFSLSHSHSSSIAWYGRDARTNDQERWEDDGERSVDHHHPPYCHPSSTTFTRSKIIPMRKGTPLYSRSLIRLRAVANGNGGSHQDNDDYDDKDINNSNGNNHNPNNWRLRLEMQWQLQEAVHDCDVDQPQTCGSEPCPDCHGSGWITCRFCRGTRFLYLPAYRESDGSLIDDDENEHDEHDEHDENNKTGIKTKFLPCTICQHQGMERCRSCQGTGWIAQWTQLQGMAR